MLVDAHVSLMKTSLSGSRPTGGRSALLASSGRPAAVARWRIPSFFARDLATLEEARQRGDAERVSIGGERRLQFLQCAVGLGRNQREDTFSLRFDPLRTSIATLWLRCHLARHARLRHPADR